MCNRKLISALAFIFICLTTSSFADENPFLDISKLNNEIESADPDQLNRLYTIRARRYVETYQYQKAIADFSHVLKNQPNGRLYLERGNVNLKAKQYNKAIADAELAEKLVPALYKEAKHLKSLALIKQNRQSGTLATVTMQGDPNRDAGAKRNYIYGSRQSRNTRKKAKASGIRDRCQAKWGNDYRMIEYCIKKQNKALQQVNSRSSGGIKQRCQEKWGNDYRMIEYCIKKQSSAQNRLGM